jgi:DNA-binding LytR/AlgR family response regulator
MNKIRTVLVDDEAPARERLRKLLAGYAEVEVVGEAQDGGEALELVSETSPDLLFLDIQMPCCDGLELAASLPSPRPWIVFCTAYDQYAVDAFELNAVDYLLKPINRARLERALRKVQDQSAGSSDGPLNKLSQSRPARFLGKRGARFRVIPQEEVLYFGSEGGLTQLVTAETYFWLQPTLAELEKRLAPTTFFRVSRSAIVRLEAVREVVPLVGGYGQIVLVTGKKLDVSRRRYKPLLEILESP